MANVPRSPGGASAGAWRIAPPTSESCDGLVPRPGRRRHVAIGERVLPGQHEPDGQRVGSRVLDPPLEDADRQRARLEVAGDDRAQLLADEADAEGVRLERLPGPREQRVVRAAAAGSVQPQAGSASGRSVERTVAVAVAVRTRRRRPRTRPPRPARSACRPTSRCQRAKSPRYVRPMLPVPSPPIGTPANVAVVDHRQVDARMAGSAQGTPMPRRQATPGIRSRPSRSVGRTRALGSRHLSTPVTTTPRMNARWARKNTTTGTAIVISAAAWISVGWVDVQRVVLLDRRSTAAGAPACCRGTAAARRSRSRRRRSGTG